MIWQDSELLINSPDLDQALDNNLFRVNIAAENERKALAQLEKYKDLDSDQCRRNLNQIVELFGDFISKGNYESIDNCLLSTDCQIMILDNNSYTKAHYSNKLGEGFSQVCKDIKINERQVLETTVDTRKNTVVQFCKCLIWNQGENIENGSQLSEKMSMEVFSISEHKIFRYKSILGPLGPEYGSRDFLKMTNKEKIVSRVKNINYALAGLDFNKTANLLDEITECKIWSWDGQKCHVFDKYSLVKTLDKMQETMKIIRIVPFEVTTCRTFRRANSNYVYYLEDKNRNDGKRYLWFSNAMYLFKENLQLEKVAFFGELHLEDEIQIPYDVFSYNVLEEKVRGLYICDKSRTCLDIFYENNVDFGCVISRFGPTKSSKTCIYMSLKAMGKNGASFKQKDYDVKFMKLVEVYVDHSDPCYDVVVVVLCNEFEVLMEGHGFKGKTGNGVLVAKVYFENGKIMKTNYFFTEIFEPVPSVFDNAEVKAHNIVARNSFY